MPSRIPFSALRFIPQSCLQVNKLRNFEKGSKYNYIVISYNYILSEVGVSSVEFNFSAAKNFFEKFVSK